MCINPVFSKKKVEKGTFCSAYLLIFFNFPLPQPSNCSMTLGEVVIAEGPNVF